MAPAIQKPSLFSEKTTNCFSTNADDNELHKKLKRYFPRRDLTKPQTSQAKVSPRSTISPRRSVSPTQRIKVSFDNILTYPRRITIQGQLIHQSYLIEKNFKVFLEKLNLGHGTEVEYADLESFIKILPTDAEITQFKERLSDLGLDSFSDVGNLKPPYYLNKIEGPEKFVIDILKDETIIEKAKIIQAIDINSQLLFTYQESIEDWKRLETYLIQNEVVAEEDLELKHWLKELFITALEISNEMKSPFEK